jgi:NADH:ubiquinone oxidoreductase subunit 3 (subunit A)
MDGKQLNKLLLSPPLVFLIIFWASVLLSKAFSKLAFNSKKPLAQGAGKSYGCGEDIMDNKAQPDYSQFFSFVFFFTIVHVAALMVSTVPRESNGVLIVGVSYLTIVVICLAIQLRKRD